MDRQQWSCEVHTMERAVASCGSCGRALCAECVAEGDGSACGPCAQLQRRRRQRLRRALAIGAVPLCGALVGLGALGRRSAAEREAARAARASHPPPEEKLACDRGAIISVGEGLLRQDNPQGALDLSNRYLRQCGEYPRLRWITFSAYKQLDRLDEAIAEAGRLIAERPTDPDYFWWRGELQERQGRREAAAADYRQSLANQPLLQRIPIDLFEVQQALERPCEALVTLQRYADLYPTLARDGRTQRRMDQARLRGGGCAEHAGAGSATFTPSPEDGLVRAPVRAEGQGAAADGTFVVDEQASFAVLTRAFAQRLGLQEGEAISIVIAGALRPARLGRLEALAARGARARHVEVAVVSDLPVAADGLLGLSYLWRFAWERRDGGLTLRPRKPPR